MCFGDGLGLLVADNDLALMPSFRGGNSTTWAHGISLRRLGFSVASVRKELCAGTRGCMRLSAAW